MPPVRITPDGFFSLLDQAGDRDATSTGPSELLGLLDGISVPDCYPDFQRQLAAYRYEVNHWSSTVRQWGQPSPPPRPPASLYAAYAAYDATIFSDPAALPAEQPPPPDPQSLAQPAPVSESLASLGNASAGMATPSAADENQSAQADIARAKRPWRNKMPSEDAPTEFEMSQHLHNDGPPAWAEIAVIRLQYRLDRAEDDYARVKILEHEIEQEKDWPTKSALRRVRMRVEAGQPVDLIEYHCAIDAAIRADVTTPIPGEEPQAEPELMSPEVESPSSDATEAATTHHCPTPIEVLRGLPPGELLTAEQLSKLTGIPRNTFQKALKKGRIPNAQHARASIRLAKAADVVPYLAAYRPKPPRAQPPV